jgi:HTH-type transcriptional regulator, sugar sensing transcriptional regulator
MVPTYVHLMALGLTEYEARTYLALLALARAAADSGEQATPPRIAREAGLPRPKVYETLERLEARGLATRVGANPIEYAPLAAREFIGRAERDFAGRIAGLEHGLARLAPTSAPEAVYPLLGAAAVQALAQDIAQNASTRLFLAGPAHLLAPLVPLVRRGVVLLQAGLAGGGYRRQPGQVPLLLARDGAAVLVAHWPSEDSSQPGPGVARREAHGIHSHNPIMVRLVEGYVALAAAGA